MSLAVRLFATPDSKVYIDIPGKAPMPLLEYIASGLYFAPPEAPYLGPTEDDLKEMITKLVQEMAPAPPAPQAATARSAATRKPRGPQKKQLKPRTPKP